MERIMKKILILIALILGISSTSALAHKVIVFAWVELGQIHVEGSFGSDRPAKNCVIKVTDSNKNLVHQGVTDAQGQYFFALPDTRDSDLLVELNAGTGHSGHWTLTKDELGVAPTPKSLGEKMAQKQDLEKNPSLVRILSGIMVIFGLAFAATWIKKRKKDKPNA